MHIVLLTQYFPPEMGAVSTRLSHLAFQFVRRGHSVTVLTAMPNYPGPHVFPGYRGFLRRETVDGINLIRSFVVPPQSGGFMQRLGCYLSFVFSSAVAGSLLVKRAGCLIAESPPLAVGLSAIWLSALKRVPLVFNVSDLYPETAIALGVLRRDSLVCRLAQRVEGWCYGRAKLITAQSREIVDSIRSRYPSSQVYHFSNGVDTALFRPGPHKEDAKHRHAECIVMYAGLHGLAQGLEQVLEAAAAMRDDPHLRFVLVGDGPAKAALVERARLQSLHNLTFVDPQPLSVVAAMLQEADIVLATLTTRIAGAVPSKIYEAMASGRALILAGAGEAAELVRRYDAGLVVDPHDVQGLVRAVRELQQRPDRRAGLASNARRAATQHFDRTQIADRFIDHLEAVLGRADRAGSDRRSPPTPAHDTDRRVL